MTLNHPIHQTRVMGLALLPSLVLIAGPLSGQTFPPEQIVGPPVPERATVDNRTILDPQQSEQRMTEARRMLREGRPIKEIATRLRGKDFAVSFNQGCGAGDARQVQVTRAMLHLVDGQFSQAFYWANLVHEDRRPSDAHTDAAIIKAWLFEGRVDALAYYWANWAQESMPSVAAGSTLIDAFKLRPAQLTRTFAHPRARNHQIDLWEGSAEARQQFVAVFRRGSYFIGALAVERTSQVNQGSLNCRFYDLTAPAATVFEPGTHDLTERSLLNLAECLTPTWKPRQRYSTVRAEVEAKVASEKRAVPLAAWWASYAITGGSNAATHVKQELQAAHAWNWQRLPANPTSNPGDYRVVGYINTETTEPSRLATLQGSLKHLHFAVLSRDGHYLRSFSLESDEDDSLPGGRVYLLTDCHKLYESLPPVNTVLADVDALLRSEAPRVAGAE